MEPQPADFRIVPVQGWGGLGIEVGQFLNGEGWSRHDHAEVYLGELYGDGKFYTASSYAKGPGLRVMDGAPSLDDGTAWSSGVIQLTAEQRQGIVTWCLSHANAGYGWLDYAALTLHRLGMDDPGLERYIASSGHMICSQYTDRAYNEGGDVHLFEDGRWDGFVTPAMLAKRIQA